VGLVSPQRYWGRIWGFKEQGAHPVPGVRNGEPKGEKRLGTKMSARQKSKV